MHKNNDLYLLRYNDLNKKINSLMKKIDLLVNSNDYLTNKINEIHDEIFSSSSISSPESINSQLLTPKNRRKRITYIKSPNKSFGKYKDINSSCEEDNNICNPCKADYTFNNDEYIPIFKTSRNNNISEKLNKTNKIILPSIVYNNSKLGQKNSNSFDL